MNPIQNTKSILVLPPEGKDNADFSAVTPVDTSRSGHVRFEFMTGSIAAAIGSVDAASPLKIQECDTVGGTFTDVTDAALADAIAATEDNKIFAIDISLLKTHKRYMKPAQPHVGDGSGTLSNFAIKAILSKPQMSPENASQQGLAELVSA